MTIVRVSASWEIKATVRTPLDSSKAQAAVSSTALLTVMLVGAAGKPKNWTVSRVRSVTVASPCLMVWVRVLYGIDGFVSV